MTSSPAPLNRLTARRFVRAVHDLLTGEVHRKAIALFVLLLIFALGVNALNVVNSYVGRDFMTAISRRDMAGFVRLACFYVGVFLLTAAVAVTYRFTEERLGLLWRDWLTKRVTERYLADRTFFHLKESSLVENPDQRIAEDVRAFTSTTLSFMLILLNATLAAFSFSGVLWAISPLLFLVAVGYAAVGSILTIRFGRPLVALNYRQSDHEAEFRTNLIHVRENAESIALQRREARLKQRLFRRIDALVANFRQITSVNRNLGFFTSGYNYLVQIIPTLIIAPSFIWGEIEFGVITQSAMAFSQLLGAFSVIVNQFGSISSFAAVVARLGSLAEAVEQKEQIRSGIEQFEAEGRIEFGGLTLVSPHDNIILLSELTLTIPYGRVVLVHGENEAARIAIFRALAGIWPKGTGTIVRPTPDNILFLTQRPYLAPGSLHDVLVRTGRDQDVSDHDIQRELQHAGLETAISRLGGLDAEIDWESQLSLREQQLLASIRILLARPRFALLDRPSTTLGASLFRQVLHRLKEYGISAIAFEEIADNTDCFDDFLEVRGDGSWVWTSSVPKPGS